MSLEPHEIAEAFCSHKFDLVFPYLADNIRWNVIGRVDLVGRDAVIAQIGQSQKFLETVTTTLLELKTIRAEPVIVMEGAAEFRDQQNQIYRVASADVFRFSDGKIVEITSYVIDLAKP